VPLIGHRRDSASCASGAYVLASDRHHLARPQPVLGHDLDQHREVQVDLARGREDGPALPGRTVTGCVILGNSHVIRVAVRRVRFIRTKSWMRRIAMRRLVIGLVAVGDT
jgi:hypothetical protein